MNVPRPFSRRSAALELRASPSAWRTVVRDSANRAAQLGLGRGGGPRAPASRARWLVRPARASSCEVTAAAAIARSMSSIERCSSRSAVTSPPTCNDSTTLRCRELHCQAAARSARCCAGHRHTWGMARCGAARLIRRRARRRRRAAGARGSSRGGRAGVRAEVAVEVRLVVVAAGLRDLGEAARRRRARAASTRGGTAARAPRAFGARPTGRGSARRSGAGSSRAPDASAATGTRRARREPAARRATMSAGGRASGEPARAARVEQREPPLPVRRVASALDELRAAAAEQRSSVDDRGR